MKEQHEVMAGKRERRIWLRWRDDLAGGMRLRKGARLFVIRTFRDPDEAGRYALCDCEEIRS